jgi:hypothetical protein
MISPRAPALQNQHHDFLCRFQMGVAIDSNFCARVCKGHNDRFADAGTASRDQRPFAVEINVLGRSPLKRSGEDTNKFW